MTLSRSTLQNNASLSFTLLDSALSARHSRKSGTMPISRSFCTECCAGLVLISPAALMYGT